MLLKLLPAGLPVIIIYCKIFSNFYSAQRLTYYAGYFNPRAIHLFAGNLNVINVPQTLYTPQELLGSFTDFYIDRMIILTAFLYGK